eukprot:COSAG06_NODE_2148_length_7473_cov_28.925142_1_plen_35_part_10
MREVIARNRSGRREDGAVNGGGGSEHRLQAPFIIV